MNFKEAYETITESKIFKDFIEKNPDAELVAGFFILDFFSNDNKDSLDYLCPNSDTVFTFEINFRGEVTVKEDKLIEKEGVPKLTRIKPEVKLELDELKSLVGTRALDEGISSQFQKIIAVLQLHEGRQVWNLTCMLEHLIIIHSLVDSETGEIIKFERKSMMDFIKKK